MSPAPEFDPYGPTPRYEQLRQSIRSAVARGELEIGAPLPSVRDQASRLGISTATAQKAYNELLREGLIRSRPGVGAFVALPKVTISREMRDRVVAAKCDALLTDAALLGLSTTNLRKLFTERQQRFGQAIRVLPPPREDDSGPDRPPRAR